MMKGKKASETPCVNSFIRSQMQSENTDNKFVLFVKFKIEIIPFEEGELQKIS